MKVTRAKFNLTATKHEDGSMSVTGYPVCSDDPNHENKVFNDATPGGHIQLHIAAGKEAQSNFPVEETREYYIDITPAK